MANGDTMTADDPEVQDTEQTDEQRATLMGVSLRGLSYLEGQLPATMPSSQGAPVVAPPLINRGGQQYLGTPAPAPTGQGRIYMGPLSGEGAFMQSPIGTRIAPPPPASLAPEAQAALQSRLAAGTQEESDASVLTRMQAQDRPGSTTIGVSRPQMPTWQDRYTVNGQTDVAGLGKEADVRNKAAMAMAMWEWNQKYAKDPTTAGPPPNRIPSKIAAAQSQEELLTKRDKEGNLFQNRGGRWYHIPDVKAPTDTETTIIPGTVGQEGVPAVPSQSGSILGIPVPWGGKPAIPAIPAIQGTPTIRRTRKVPSDLSTIGSATATTSASAIPTAVTPPNVAAPSKPTKTTARDKAIRANALAIAHPEWTDAQIKDAVRKEMAR